MRAFVAIALPETFCANLYAYTRPWRALSTRISWVPPERMHLTLRFLGEISEKQGTAVGDALEKACRSIPVFSMYPKKVGAFPHLERPKVLWLGVEADEGNLERLAQSADDAAMSVGLGKPDHPFRPHITLGRVRSSKGLEPLTHAIDEGDAPELPEMMVDSVVLFFSEPGLRGPVYREVKRVALKYTGE